MFHNWYQFAVSDHSKHWLIHYSMASTSYTAYVIAEQLYMADQAWIPEA